MKYEVILRPGAKLDVLNIFEYLLSQASLDVAERWLGAFDEALRSLEVMPLRCGLAREHGQFSGRDLRQRNFLSHRMVFLVKEGRVHVLRVLHAAQDAVEVTDLGIDNEGDTPPFTGRVRSWGIHAAPL